MERLDRQSWVDAGLAALAQGGLAAVRVELLAKRLSVTKGSFYWHFPGREALLAAMLEVWEQRQTGAVIAAVEAAGGPPEERLARLSAALSGLDLRLEAAMRGWGAADAQVRAALGRADARRCAYLQELIERAGVPPEPARARARLVYFALIGEIASGAEDWLAPHQAAMALNAPMLLRWP